MSLLLAVRPDVELRILAFADGEGGGRDGAVCRVQLTPLPTVEVRLGRGSAARVSGVM